MHTYLVIHVLVVCCFFHNLVWTQENKHISIDAESHTHVRTYVHTSKTDTNNIHACTYIHAYTYIHECTHIHSYMHTFIHLYIHCSFMHAFIDTYVRTYAHAYVHIYTYTDTYHSTVFSQSYQNQWVLRNTNRP